MPVRFALGNCSTARGETCSTARQTKARLGQRARRGHRLSDVFDDREALPLVMMASATWLQYVVGEGPSQPCCR
jgi:hypothetical protein